MIVLPSFLYVINNIALKLKVGQSSSEEKINFLVGWTFDPLFLRNEVF